MDWSKKTTYKESTGMAINAMMESACKDEYIDKKRKTNFPQKKKREVSLKDIREWNKKRSYKSDTAVTVNAMMESANNDPYVDLNPPSRF